MSKIARRRTGLVLVAAVMGAGAPSLTGCAGAIVHTRGDTSSQVANVTAVVSLPPRLGFGKAGEQRRVARRTADSLIDATGGRAVIADELPSVDPELIADGVRGVGEDPEHTLTFAVIAARSERVEASAIPAAGNHSRPIRRYVDYTVRLDIRRCDRQDIVGSIETFASVLASAPEIDKQGRSVGLQRAIDDAIHQGLASFAPNLLSAAPFATLVEIPARADPSSISGALAAVDKLRRLQVLYPELPPQELASLAASRARLLVVNPGRLAAFGLVRGDLLSGTGGRTLDGRAALARTLSRGTLPAMSIDRGGGRFLVGQTLIASAVAPATAH